MNNKICMITDFSILNSGKWCVGPNGELASSKSNLISRYKTNPKTVERVMKKYNLDFNDALGWIEKNGKKRKPPVIKIGDKVYRTYDAAARHNCIDKERLAKLIKDGKNPTDAAAELICEKIVYTAPNGQKFEDTDAIARILGCSKKVVKKYLFSMAPQNGEEIKKKRTCKSTIPVEKRTYNGRVYESISEMIRQCGVSGLSYEAYYYRVNKKEMTIEQALRTPVRKAASVTTSAPAESISFEPAKAKTAAASASPTVVKTVASEKKAVNTSKHHRVNVHVPAKRGNGKADVWARTFEGVVYGTQTEMVETRGVSGLTYKTYNMRLKRGWSVEKALLTPARSRKNKDNRDETPSRDDLSSKKRSRRSNVPAERRTFNGVEYPSVAAMVRACAVPGVALNLYNHRIRLGWSMKKALLTPSTRKK